MKINTKLKIAVLAPALMALIVSLTLVYSYMAMKEVQENGDIVRRIRSSLTEINSFIYTYALYHEERPKQQFLVEHDSLMSLIAGIRLRDPEQQQLLNSIRTNSESLKVTFLRLLSNYEHAGDYGKHELYADAEDRLIGQLLVRYREMDTDASRLRRLVDDGIRKTQVWTISFIFIFMVGTAIPLMIILYVMMRSTNASLAVLRKGTEVVGAGNLEYRISMSGQDELAELARSFNDMTDELREVTVSKDQLQKEMDERKRAEEELRLSEEKFAKAFAGNPAAIAMTSLDGLFLEVNDTWMALTGFSRDEVIGRFAREINIWPNSEAASRFVKGLREKGSIQDWEQELHKKSGEVFVAQLSAQILTVRGEDLILSAFLDITGRKQTEAEREKLISNLEAANKELESFSYTVSHDLRAPLRAIDGFSQMLLRDIGDKLDSESARKFNVISNNSKKMGQLIDDLLKLSQAARAPVHFERININSVVEDVWKEILAGNPGRKMELVIGELPIARGGRTLLRQVFSNLLSNAVKFTKNREKAEIEVSGSNSGDFNSYCIQDNGVGFDMRYYDKVFEIFHRLHSEREYEGTGVGLAIVRKIIERHGGKIWAESRPGEGTTFYFTLPAQE